MSGAGNDFVLLSARDVRTPRSRWAALARQLCDRKGSVGADGLLILGRAKAPHASGKPAFRLHYLNADGSRAFCGNGSRCAAWWAFRTGLARGSALTLLTDSGALLARRAGFERIVLEMPGVQKVRLGLRLRLNGSARTLHSLHTGVPHVVVPVQDLSRAPVEKWGRILRRHPRFRPAGTNVNFVRFLKSSRLEIRTYERGVEAETLACGTGVTASAVAAYLLGRADPPIRCRTRGGDWLTVDFREEEGRIRKVRLEGPAKITFMGEVPC